MKEQDNLRLQIRSYLNRLPRRQRHILVERFGLSGSPKSFTSIAGEVAGSTQEIQHECDSALRRLRYVPELIAH